MMDPQAISAAAQTANQVGLLTWLVVAITLFCGALTCYILYQNGKREERYAKLVEVHIDTLGGKIDGYRTEIKESLSLIQEANRMNKQEHGLMISSLQEILKSMTELNLKSKLNHQ